MLLHTSRSMENNTSPLELTPSVAASSSINNALTLSYEFLIEQIYESIHAE